jgi:hypothetical protein
LQEVPAKAFFSLRLLYKINLGGTDYGPEGFILVQETGIKTIGERIPLGDSVGVRKGNSN